MKNKIVLAVIFTVLFSFTAFSQTPAISISSVGNIGIGTTNVGSAKLTVKGKIISSELRIRELANIPDYVFKSDYRLMPLEEVETFVKENSHLPEIPSEKEFLENGMNVADMNLLLLKKIEELTLYIIEQDKEIKTLKRALSISEDVIFK